MYIAVDDTDSRSGMCTTYLATELISEFAEYQLLGYPRLVRLNPNVPWKTRGNGALVMEFGKGVTKIDHVGYVSQDVFTWEGDPCIKDEILERAVDVVSRWAQTDQEETNPGIIFGNQRPDPELYHRGVKDILHLQDVLTILKSTDLSYQGMGNRRGLIGAAAALSWIPHDFTYELIAYRHRDNWGRTRNINDQDVKTFQENTEFTFDSYDHTENKQTIAPTSPCPVLYGVRGEEPMELKKALDLIGSEEPCRHLTFLTNQGTDDHIQPKTIEHLRPYISAQIRSRVVTEPETMEGGHVFFEIKDDTGAVTAAAYEPTKSFRDVIKELAVGDEIELWGGVRKEPLTLNIEKIKINKLVDKRVKISNPACPSCGKNMSSIGKNAGFRCKTCSKKVGEDAVPMKTVPRNISEAHYEVPVVARRHLSKPLVRSFGEKGYS